VTLLVAETFRMGGHATHDEREARAHLSTPRCSRPLGARDPVGLYETWILILGAGDVGFHLAQQLATRRTTTWW
jgi:hypothetical protein